MEVAKLLLESNSDPGIRDESGRTAPDEAILFEKWRVAYGILEYKARLDGLIPDEWEVRNGDEEVLRRGRPTAEIKCGFVGRLDVLETTTLFHSYRE